jgi:hypothetical protein
MTSGVRFLHFGRNDEWRGIGRKLFLSTKNQFRHLALLRSTGAARSTEIRNDEECVVYSSFVFWPLK